MWVDLRLGQVRQVCKSLRACSCVEANNLYRFISSDKARLPSHKFMEKARLETFSAGKGWIHDRTPDHVASSINVCPLIILPITIV